MTENSIRDELAEVVKSADLTAPEESGSSEEYWHAWKMHVADAILASPAIRRIQAEAIRGAAREIAETFGNPDRRRPRDPEGKVSTDYLNDPQWAEQIVRDRAERVEKGKRVS